MELRSVWIARHIIHRHFHVRKCSHDPRATEVVRHKQKSVTSHLRSLRCCPLPAGPLDPSPPSRTTLFRLRRMRHLLCHHPRRSQIRVEACPQEISSKSLRRTIGQHKCYPCCRSSCYQVRATKTCSCLW